MRPIKNNAPVATSAAMPAVEPADSPLCVFEPGMFVFVDVDVDDDDIVVVAGLLLMLLLTLSLWISPA